MTPKLHKKYDLHMYTSIVFTHHLLTHQQYVSDYQMIVTLYRIAPMRVYPLVVFSLTGGSFSDNHLQHSLNFQPPHHSVASEATFPELLS